VRRAIFYLVLALLCFAGTAAVVFNVAFLASVLPHGGLY
jgi:hypothetical protein